MHRRVSHFPTGRCRDERGAVAIVVALSMLAILVGTAMVLDFGLVRVDRQVDKSAADAATLAGLHGLNAGGTEPRPFIGVCTALRYMQENDARFAGMTDTAGTWTDGLGSPKGNGCDLTNTTLRNQICVGATAETPTSWARFTWSPPSSDRLTVTIQSGYSLVGTSWSEDALPAAQSDPGDANKHGCDQLAVSVTQKRKPGLGSLATNSDLVSSIRSVGRVKVGPGGDAPAMLLLKRTGCTPNALQIGGTNSFIHVLGFASASGVSQPGTIHTDDDGLNGCSSSGGKQIFAGANVADSIVAYAAPSTGKPGRITSVAGNYGVSLPTVRDSASDVYGATGLNAGASGTHMEPTGRGLVSRQPVDFRYLSTVKSITSDSSSYFALNFTSKTAANTANWGYASCASNGSIAPAQIDPYLATRSGLYIDCDQVTSIPGETIAGWKTVVFKGSLKTAGGGSIKLPDATRVYLGGSSSSATTISGTGATFEMHTTGLTSPVATTVFPDGKRCNSAQTSDRAVLVIKNGSLSDDYLFRACNTTVVLLGGDTYGCTPSYDPVTEQTGPAPTHGPCPSSSVGTGQLNVNGFVDWTAPNQCTVITKTSCDGTALGATDGWYNASGPEDLALWTESAAFGSTNAVIGGSSSFNLQGVFVTPNFDPLTLGGGPSTTLTNAQFIASALSLNGGAQLTMTVDPNSAVTVNRMVLVGLVR
jgi:Flp pilus assembly protein TadG